MHDATDLIPTTAQSPEVRNPQDLAPGQTRREDPSLIASTFAFAINEAERYVEGRKDHVADLVIDLAATLRRSGRRFEGQQDWIADAVDGGAAKLRDLAEDFRDTDVRTMLDTSWSIARRRPLLVAAGAAAIALVGARYARHTVAQARRYDRRAA